MSQVIFSASEAIISVAIGQELYLFTAARSRSKRPRFEIGGVVVQAMLDRTGVWSFGVSRREVGAPMPGFQVEIGEGVADDSTCMVLHFYGPAEIEGWSNCTPVRTPAQTPPIGYEAGRVYSQERKA